MDPVHSHPKTAPSFCSLSSLLQRPAVPRLLTKVEGIEGLAQHFGYEALIDALLAAGAARTPRAAGVRTRP